jgi:hypothetical protein
MNSSQAAGLVPAPVANVARLMAGFSRPWALCGGWGVDAWLGRQTRDHDDIDLAVFEDGLEALRLHLDGWRLVAHDTTDDDGDTPWLGRRLYMPAHIHARNGDANLDIQVNEHDGDAWLLSREPRLVAEPARLAGACAWGLPALAPEVILFYKARELRQKDGVDFEALRHRLSGEQTRWLRGAIAGFDPAHAWLGAL